MTSTLSPLARAHAISTERVDGVLVITLDQPGESVNKVDVALRDELESVCKEIDADHGVRAAVLISGKPEMFIAGADIQQFLEFRSAADGERASRTGQEMLNRIEDLRVPVVAAIHGACLGAGLETALACTHRIVTDHPKTVLALPEVQLGLIPGAGGTQRLPKLVGLQGALSMILEGRNVRAKKALQMGLADEMVHPAILREVSIQRARALADATARGSRDVPDRGSRGEGRSRKRGPASILLEDNPIGRALVFRKARESVLAKTHGQYPAPLAALDVVRRGYDDGFELGLREEARRFGELAMTDVSRELIFLFYATTALKKDPGVEEPAPRPPTVKKIGVLGAGFMGAGITAVAVQAGTLVRLKDTDTARVGRGLAALREVLQERLARKQITRPQLENQMALAGGTTEYSGFGNVDLVIEAVFEDLTLKHRVLREVEPLLPARAVYASNTSTIPIGRIADASAHPGRVLGMHFFSPVHKMPLLEVIVTPQTTRDATVTAVAFGKQLGKTVIVVNDGPGFYTTRTLSAYMNEAGKLLEEGAAIDAVDRALVDFGFPVGPLTLLDEVGIDVGGKVGVVLGEAFGARMAPSDAMRRVVEAGRLGRKGKLGFYRYGADGKKGDVDESVYDVIGPHDRAAVEPQEVVQRCVLAMTNEAVRCLEEGILRSARDGDVGAVFGIGFPPFRGGPFRYVDSVGVEAIVRQLTELDARFRPRFRPASLLVDMARAAAGADDRQDRGRFYPAEGNPLKQDRGTQMPRSGS